MKVFVTDRYPPVRERLIGMISAIGGVEVVGQEDGDICVAAATARLDPSVVVLDMGSGAIDRLAKLRLMKAGRRAPVLVLLADSPFWLYKEKLLSSGADFVFHRSDEFGKLLELIKRMSEERSPCN